MEVKHHSIAIVGGGICGMIFAIGLLRRGIPFHIFEASPILSEIGAGIALNQNGILAMSKISPELLKTFNLLVTKNADPEEEEVWINFRRGDDTGELIASVRSTDVNKTGMSSVHRGELLAALAAQVPQKHITFSARLTKLEYLPSTHVRLVFENGAIEEAEAVVGCDGIRSQVRQLLFGREFGPRFTGRYAYRGLVPMEHAKTALGVYAASNSHLYCGRGGHVLTYQIDKGATLNVVACGSMEGGWKNEKWILKNDTKQMREDFKDWGGAVKKIINLVKDVDCWGLFEHPPSLTFFRNRVVLLGDAAHASTPHQGAGVGQGIEDALVLAELLQARATHSIAYEKVFEAYDTVRRPRAQKVVVTSREAGEMYAFRDPFRDDVEAIKRDLLSRFDWIWNEDIEAQVEDAKAVLRRMVGPRNSTLLQ